MRYATTRSAPSSESKPGGASALSPDSRQTLISYSLINLVAARMVDIPFHSCCCTSETGCFAPSGARIDAIYRPTGAE